MAPLGVGENYPGLVFVTMGGREERRVEGVKNHLSLEMTGTRKIKR